MRHGYTNSTERIGDTVLKRYAGPGSADRARAERRALTQLRGRFPVPDLIAASGNSVTTRFVAGHCREWAPCHPGIAQWQERAIVTADWGPLDGDAE